MQDTVQMQKSSLWSRDEERTRDASDGVNNIIAAGFVGNQTRRVSHVTH